MAGESMTKIVFFSHRACISLASKNRTIGNAAKSQVQRSSKDLSCQKINQADCWNWGVLKIRFFFTDYNKL